MLLFQESSSIEKSTITLTPILIKCSIAEAFDLFLECVRASADAIDKTKVSPRCIKGMGRKRDQIFTFPNKKKISMVSEAKSALIIPINRRER